jgi:hypothetical protein
MTGEPDELKGSSPVRREADGKVLYSVVKVQKEYGNSPAAYPITTCKLSMTQAAP